MEPRQGTGQHRPVGFDTQFEIAGVEIPVPAARQNPAALAQLEQLIDEASAKIDALAFHLRHRWTPPSES